MQRVVLHVENVGFEERCSGLHTLVGRISKGKYQIFEAKLTKNGVVSLFFFAQRVVVSWWERIFNQVCRLVNSDIQYECVQTAVGWR